MLTYQSAIQRDRTATSHADLLKMFISHRCYCNPRFGVSHKDLRMAYLTWCREYDRTSLSDQRFTECLAALGYRERIGVNTGWDGLRLL